MGESSWFIELPETKFSDESLKVTAQQEGELSFVGLVGLLKTSEEYGWQIAATRFHSGSGLDLDLDRGDWLLWLIAHADAATKITIELDGQVTTLLARPGLAEVAYYYRDGEGELRHNSSRSAVVETPAGTTHEFIRAAHELNSEGLVFTAISYQPALGAAKIATTWRRPGDESRVDRVVLSPLSIQTEVALGTIAAGESAIEWESTGAGISEMVLVLHVAAPIGEEFPRVADRDFEGVFIPQGTQLSTPTGFETKR